MKKLMKVKIKRNIKLIIPKLNSKYEYEWKYKQNKFKKYTINK